MTTRTIIIRRGSYCQWPLKKARRGKIFGETKRKIENTKAEILGFINPVFMVLVLVVLAGFFYLYSINCTAAKGSQVKQVEKDISELKSQNEQLKIREAELKSLYHVEEATKDLNMAKLHSVVYVEEVGPFALK